MVTMTKSLMTELFNSSKSYTEIAEQLSTPALTITEKMVQTMFRENDFNLRSRKRKSAESWYTVVDDTAIPTSHTLGTSWGSPVDESEKVDETKLTEEFA